MLLGQAMEGAEAPDEVYGVDADDFSGGEAGGDCVEGVTVVGVVEGGNEDEGVGDVEVGVGGGEALAFEEDGGRHGEGSDFERLAGGVAGGVEAREVFGKREVVLVGGVGFDGGEDGIGADEASDVVYVAVGVVAGAAPVKPDGLGDAELVGEGGFELGAGDAGVALLGFGEEALFGGDEGACAVDVDRAAFEDQAMGGAVGEEDFGAALGQVVEAGDVLGDLIIAMPVAVLGPAVEAPVGKGKVALRAQGEDGAGVAEPDAVGGPLMEVDAGEVGSAALENGGGATLGGLVVDENVNVFDAGEVSDDLGVDPGDGLELTGPVVGVLGPGDPGGGVGLPLGGHAEGGEGRGHELFSQKERSSPRVDDETVEPGASTESRLAAIA